MPSASDMLGVTTGSCQKCAHGTNGSSYRSPFDVCAVTLQVACEKLSLLSSFLSIPQVSVIDKLLSKPKLVESSFDLLNHSSSHCDISTVLGNLQS